MTGDDDLHSLLPQPPPPAPKRREAAITEALARFDGAPVAERRPRPADTAPWWKSLRGPQAGLLATAALVAAISLPFAWTTLNPGAPVADERVSPSPREGVRVVARDTVDVPAAASTATAPSEGADRVEPKTPARAPAPAAPPAKRVELAQAETFAPAAVAAKAQQAAPIVVQGRAAPRPSLEAASPVSVVSADRVSESDDVIVTGTRVSKPPRRGDWNACTVNDPSRTLSKCRKLANKGAKAVRAQADAHLSDGLKHAWEGDLDEAIGAFDQAIAVAPDLSVAYLNRGLVYDRQGESARAIADLDRAIRHAPQSARAYYNRSLLLRKNGDTRRADLDERRAISLDNRYQAAPRPD